jgi:hypothetical protein
MQYGNLEMKLRNMRKASMTEEQSEFGLDECQTDEETTSSLERSFVDTRVNYSSLSLTDLAHQTYAMFSSEAFDGNHPTADTHPDFYKLEDGTEEMKNALQCLQSCCFLQGKLLWHVFEVRIRPDVSTEAMLELSTTVLLAQGLKVEEAEKGLGSQTTKNSMFFRRHVLNGFMYRPPTMSHSTQQYENVFVHCGVSATKLRVLRLYVCLSPPSSVFIPPPKSFEHRANLLFSAIRRAIMDIGYSLMYLEAPAFSADGDMSEYIPYIIINPKMIFLYVK